MKISDRFKYLKIQISFYYFITTISLFIVFGMILYLSVSNIIFRDELSDIATSIEQSGNYIETYIDKLKALTELVSKDSNLICYLEGEPQGSRQKVGNLIENTLGTDAYLKSVIIVGIDGEVISNEEKLDMSVSDDMMKEQWYVDALTNNGMPSLTSIRRQTFIMDKENWVISVSKEIINGEGENLGVLLLDIDYEVIDSYLEDLKLGDDGNAFILTEQGEVVYHRDVTYFSDQKKKEALKKVADMANGYDSNSKLLLHHYNIENTPWVLVGVSALDELNGLKRQMIEILILLGLILGISIVGSGFFIARRITNPILKLEKAMQSIDQGLKKVEIEKNSSHEIKNLSNHYNQMIDKMKALMHEIKENETYIRHYEIKALQSQINPHFLYNTLDTIVWMAEFGDSEKVIAVTKSLAGFFRISLSNGNELISIEDEIEHVKAYLFIQKQRYEEKLSYEIELDDCVAQMKIPKIILQPLVENALYHGIRECDHNGLIQVRIESVANDVHMIIQDDGVGFDKKRVSKKTKLGGVGIENVNQRIKLYYGEDYGITIESEIDQGTIAKIIIPRG